MQNTRHIGLIVSPLRALMDNQVERWNDANITCAAIKKQSEMSEEDIEGKVQVWHLVYTDEKCLYSINTIKRDRGYMNANSAMVQYLFI